jgi:class 3 adenylate cyclase
LTRARFPLRSKIALFAAGQLVLAVLGLSYFTVVEPWQQKIAAQANAARTLVDTVAPSIVQLSAAGPRWNADGVRALFETQRIGRLGEGSHSVNAVYAIIFDGEGKLIEDASAVNQELLGQLAPAIAALYLRDRPRALSLLARGGPTRLRSIRVRLASGDNRAVVGHLELGLSTASIDAEARQGIMRELAVLGATLLFGVIFAIAMGGRIASPLAALSAAMKQIEQGDLGVGLQENRSQDEVGDLSRAFNRMIDGLRERERLRGTLGRYVSGDVAERILAEEDDFSLKGELRRVTVLFLDVRGFTNVSERLQPPQVLELLNEYFHIVVDKVQVHGGSVNKFIGDAAMCIWGAPRPLDRPEYAAVTCALEIQAAARALSDQRRAAGLVSVGIGIGINAGEAVAGNLGAAQRLEYTVIGDTVNLAQRLESQAREGEILISQTVYDRIASQIEVRPREAVRLKGRSRPVALWEVLSRKTVVVGTEAA